MKNFWLLFSAALMLLFPLSVRADIFEAPEDQIYLENLNNLERLRLSTFGGIHGENRNPVEDLKFLEMTMREMQKKHKGDKRLQSLLNEVKKTMSPATRVYKKKEQTIIHSPCEKDRCAFLTHLKQRVRYVRFGRSYPIDDVIGQLEPKIQKVEYRRRRKLEMEEMEQLRDYAEKLSTFDKSCRELEKYIRQLMPK